MLGDVFASLENIDFRIALRALRGILVGFTSRLGRMHHPGLVTTLAASIIAEMMGVAIVDARAPRIHKDTLPRFARPKCQIRLFLLLLLFAQIPEGTTHLTRCSFAPSPKNAAAEVDGRHGRGSLGVQD